MDDKLDNVFLETQLKEAELKGRKEGMAAVLAALSAADAEQLSKHTHNHRLKDTCSNYFQARLDAALLDAAKQNQADVVFSLVKAGADTKACNKADHSALFVAVEERHLEVVQALLKAGANPDYAGECSIKYCSKSPFECAVSWGDIAIVKALLEAGADVHNGEEPGKGYWLINYSLGGDVELTRALLKAGAYIGPPKHGGWTPLMQAAFNGKTESVALLIKAGSDVNVKIDCGNTALMLAARGFGMSEGFMSATIRLLLDFGAEINHKNKEGSTALIWAAEDGHSGAVRLLLSAGADVFYRAPSIPARMNRSASKAGNVFDLATDNTVKEIIKSEMHRRIAAALSVLPMMALDVRQKIIQLYTEE